MKIERVPEQVFHPSEYIRDEMRYRDWSHEQFALKAGMNLTAAIALIRGDCGVTPRAAEALARAFGTSATLWYRLQKTYDAGTKWRI